MRTKKPVATVAIAKVATPDGKEAFAVEFVFTGKPHTIALEGSEINNDATLLEYINTIVDYVKEKYNG